MVDLTAKSNYGKGPDGNKTELSVSPSVEGGVSPNKASFAFTKSHVFLGGQAGYAGSMDLSPDTKVLFGAGAYGSAGVRFTNGSGEKAQNDHNPKWDVPLDRKDGLNVNDVSAIIRIIPNNNFKDLPVGKAVELVEQYPVLGNSPKFGVLNKLPGSMSDLPPEVREKLYSITLGDTASAAHKGSKIDNPDLGKATVAINEMLAKRGRPPLPEGALKELFSESQKGAANYAKGIDKLPSPEKLAKVERDLDKARRFDPRIDAGAYAVAGVTSGNNGVAATVEKSVHANYGSVVLTPAGVKYDIALSNKLQVEAGVGKQPFTAETTARLGMEPGPGVHVLASTEKINWPNYGTGHTTTNTVGVGASAKALGGTASLDVSKSQVKPMNTPSYKDTNVGATFTKKF